MDRCDRSFHNCWSLNSVKALGEREDWFGDQFRKPKVRSEMEETNERAVSDTAIIIKNFLIKMLEPFKVKILAELKVNCGRFGSLRKR